MASTWSLDYVAAGLWNGKQSNALHVFTARIEVLSMNLQILSTLSIAQNVKKNGPEFIYFHVVNEDRFLLGRRYFSTRLVEGSEPLFDATDPLVIPIPGDPLFADAIPQI